MPSPPCLTCSPSRWSLRGRGEARVPDDGAVRTANGNRRGRACRARSRKGEEPKAEVRDNGATKRRRRESSDGRCTGADGARNLARFNLRQRPAGRKKGLQGGRGC